MTSVCQCIPSIFVFYVDKNQADNPWRQRVEVWISLVRVSAMAKHRVWIIKFLEPATFKYTCDNTPVRDALDVWPALPLVIRPNSI
jgi:hypothetical protein